MNRNFSLATVIATSAIALTVLFSAASSAKSPCLSARRSSVDWSKTPLLAVLTIPGIALAATLYAGGRSHQK